MVLREQGKAKWCWRRSAPKPVCWRSLRMWAWSLAGGWVRAVVGVGGAFGRGGGLAGEVATEPFADGVAGAGELACGGLECVALGAGDQRWMEPMAVGAHTVGSK